MSRTKDRLIEKTEWYAIVAIIAGLFGLYLLMSTAMAATVSEHNEEHTAYNAAIQILVERGCTPKFTRTKRYVVDATTDAVTIISKEVSQECKAKAHVITWAAPVDDELNRPLPPDAIAGYELTINGQLQAFTASTEYRAEGLKTGDIVGLVTVGNNGLKSQEAFKDVP